MLVIALRLLIVTDPIITEIVVSRARTATAFPEPEDHLSSDEEGTFFPASVAQQHELSFQRFEADAGVRLTKQRSRSTFVGCD